MLYTAAEFYSVFMTNNKVQRFCHFLFWVLWSHLHNLHWVQVWVAGHTWGRVGYEQKRTSSTWWGCISLHWLLALLRDDGGLDEEFHILLHAHRCGPSARELGPICVWGVWCVCVYCIDMIVCCVVILLYTCVVISTCLFSNVLYIYLCINSSQCVSNLSSHGCHKWYGTHNITVWAWVGVYSVYQNAYDCLYMDWSIYFSQYT